MSSDLVFGYHAVGRRIASAPDSCIELLCVQGKNPRLASIIDQAKNQGVVVRFSNRDSLTAVCESSSHQGCVLRFEGSTGPVISLQECLGKIGPSSLFLVLDGVTDPHNLGACLRTADATAVDAVIIPSDRSAKLTPVVRKVAAGAAETVPLIEVTNLVRAIRELQEAGVWVYGTSGDAEQTVYGQSFKSSSALVMGAEGSGLRRLTREACDFLVKLPMSGVVESLNVSVATGVFLYQMRHSMSENP
jgi:23S rRNA (guanosine2251-2'-O)-methyltransferase